MPRNHWHAGYRYSTGRRGHSNLHPEISYPPDFTQLPRASRSQLSPQNQGPLLLQAAQRGLPWSEWRFCPCWKGRPVPGTEPEGQPEPSGGGPGTHSLPRAPRPAQSHWILPLQPTDCLGAKALARCPSPSPSPSPMGSVLSSSPPTLTAGHSSAWAGTWQWRKGPTVAPTPPWRQLWEQGAAACPERASVNPSAEPRPGWTVPLSPVLGGGLGSSHSSSTQWPGEAVFCLRTHKTRYANTRHAGQARPIRGLNPTHGPLAENGVETAQAAST